MQDDHFWREAQAGSACLCPPLGRRLHLGRPAGGPFERSVALVANGRSDRRTWRALPSRSRRCAGCVAASVRERQSVLPRCRCPRLLLVREFRCLRRLRMAAACKPKAEALRALLLGRQGRSGGSGRLRSVPSASRIAHGGLRVRTSPIGDGGRCSHRGSPPPRGAAGFGHGLRQRLDLAAHAEIARLSTRARRRS